MWPWVAGFSLRGASGPIALGLSDFLWSVHTFEGRVRMGVDHFPPTGHVTRKVPPGLEPPALRGRVFPIPQVPEGCGEVGYVLDSPHSRGCPEGPMSTLGQDWRGASTLWSREPPSELCWGSLHAKQCALPLCRVWG